MGEQHSFGAPVVRESCVLQSTEALGGDDQAFDRQHDAEFKLLTHFHATIRDAQNRPLTAVLWSRFPVCCSCNDATKQLQRLLPRLQLTIVELHLLEAEPIGITE